MSEHVFAVVLVVGMATLASGSLTSASAMQAPGAGLAATELRAEVGCDGAQPIARLMWTPGGGQVQQIQIATALNGFDKEAFDLSEPLAPSQSLVVWDRVAPTVLHYWRVLTLQGGTWIPSETGTFNGTVCVGDRVGPRSP